MALQNQLFEARTGELGRVGERGDACGKPTVEAVRNRLWVGANLKDSALVKRHVEQARSKSRQAEPV